MQPSPHFATICRVDLISVQHKHSGDVDMMAHREHWHQLHCSWRCLSKRSFWKSSVSLTGLLGGRVTFPSSTTIGSWEYGSMISIKSIECVENTCLLFVDKWASDGGTHYYVTSGEFPLRSEWEDGGGQVREIWINTDCFMLCISVGQDVYFNQATGLGIHDFYRFFYVYMRLRVNFSFNLI